MIFESVVQKDEWVVKISCLGEGFYLGNRLVNKRKDLRIIAFEVPSEGYVQPLVFSLVTGRLWILYRIIGRTYKAGLEESSQGDFLPCCLSMLPCFSRWAVRLRPASLHLRRPISSLALYRCSIHLRRSSRRGPGWCNHSSIYK